MSFSPVEYWKALILYGRNTATYKIALGKTLIEFCSSGFAKVDWNVLADSFLKQYESRLLVDTPMPQLDHESRTTVMERVVSQKRLGRIDHDEAVSIVAAEAFNDVIPRFQNLGKSAEFQGKFYTFEMEKSLLLTDDLHTIVDAHQADLDAELDARWSLLEGAFQIGRSNFQLSNDLRDIYIVAGYQRKDITKNIPFLQGYQGNICFYCGEPIPDNDIEVDHVLPRQVVQHDAIWNLVLSHSFCNGQKTDRLVGPHFIEKLVARNENIMGSNHPWKKKIEAELGRTKPQRKKMTQQHYDRVASILGWNYWNGDSSYNPETDPFFRKLVTVINNDK